MSDKFWWAHAPAGLDVTVGPDWKAQGEQRFINRELGAIVSFKGELGWEYARLHPGKTEILSQGGYICAAHAQAAAEGAYNPAVDSRDYSWVSGESVRLIIQHTLNRVVAEGWTFPHISIHISAFSALSKVAIIERLRVTQFAPEHRLAGYIWRLYSYPLSTRYFGPLLIIHDRGYVDNRRVAEAEAAAENGRHWHDRIAFADTEEIKNDT